MENDIPSPEVLIDFRLEVSVRFKLVDWSDLEPGDHFYCYSLEPFVPECQRQAWGPCTMVDPVNRIILNAQRVRLKYEKTHNRIQLMLPLQDSFPLVPESHKQ